MEPAILQCCEQNDPEGLTAMVQAMGRLPREICGEALYICAMRGSTRSARELLPFTTCGEQQRALFRAMELRCSPIVALLLRWDQDRKLLRTVPAAAGGAHVLLGHALELAAELGDEDLASITLEHMYDPLVDPGPRPRSDATLAAVKQDFRAHHWCWPNILRAKHVAELRGHGGVSMMLSIACHGDRPSNPSTPRLASAHSHHSGHISTTMGRHATRREQRRWHPAMSVDGTRSTLPSSNGGWLLDDESTIDSRSISTSIVSGPAAATARRNVLAAAGRLWAMQENQRPMGPGPASTDLTVVSGAGGGDPSVRSSRFYHYGEPLEHGSAGGEEE